MCARARAHARACVRVCVRVRERDRQTERERETKSVVCVCLSMCTRKRARVCTRVCAALKCARVLNSPTFIITQVQLVMSIEYKETDTCDCKSRRKYSSKTERSEGGHAIMQKKCVFGTGRGGGHAVVQRPVCVVGWGGGHVVMHNRGWLAAVRTLLLGGPIDPAVLTPSGAPHGISRRLGEAAGRIDSAHTDP